MGGARVIRDRLVRVSEAAAVLSVHADTIHRWFREGVLTRRKLPYGRGARVLESELRAIVEGTRVVSKRVPVPKLALVR